MVPMGVWMARATQSTSECVTRMGMMENGAEGEAAAGEDLDQLGVVEQAMLFELALDQGEGELGAVDGDVELGEDPGQAADVVLVAVGEDDGADFIAVFGEIADVGDDDVDAQEFFFGEHQAGIDDDDVILPPEGQAVHTELAQAPEGDHSQFFYCHGSSVYPTKMRGRLCGSHLV